MGLANKVALITGGAGDIAVAVAARFLEHGAAVVLTDIDAGQLGRAVAMLDGGPRVATVVADVRRLADMERAADEAERTFGRLDILVTCAGVLRHLPIDQMSVDDWHWVVEINLTGTFMACKAVVPRFKKAGGGRIVTISSVGGRTGRPRVGVNYAASKAGVQGLTMCLARELGTFGITVNCVAPGPLSGRMTDSMPPEDVQRLISTACIERLGRPDDIAGAVLYLASDDAAWVSGEILDVNGGVYI